MTHARETRSAESPDAQDPAPGSPAPKTRGPKTSAPKTRAPKPFTASGQRFAAVDGRGLVYDDEGPDAPTGLPVLCLAGLTRDARDFAPLAGRLVGTHRVIRLDSRGRGRSDWAADPLAEYQVPVEAGDAIALLDHLEIERAIIVGTSRGGLLAMGMTALAPGRLAGVVLNDIGPVIEREGLDNIRGYIGRTPQAETMEEVAAALAATLHDVYPDFAQADWRDLARRLFHVDGEGRPALSYDPRLAEPVERAFAAEQPDLWPFFDALAPVPLVAIRGGRSNILSAATLEEMQRRHPDMVAITLDNRGHVPILDEPPALAAITGLLESVS
ncbi:MAG: alpha/beta hydrolase [Pseudomonadota bacterium]